MSQNSVTINVFISEVTNENKTRITTCQAYISNCIIGVMEV